MTQLSSIPFDIYQRYKLVSDIIDKFRSPEEQFKILDVGAGFEESLNKFLPYDAVYYLDKAYPPEYSEKRNFIVGDILSIELTEKFDFIVAIDVYEHIPPKDRKKFIDSLIVSSKIATIIAAPFNKENVKFCESFANEIYKNSHGSDYIWLKEHIANGLPSLSLTLDLVKEHHLQPVIIPNGYLPRWFEMISIFLLTEGRQESSSMMTILSELYNQHFYQYDNRDPSYRKVIIIPKDGQDIDFSDLISKSVDSEDLTYNNQLLESFIEKIKRSYQIDKKFAENIPINNEQLVELTRNVQDLTAQLTERDLRILSLEQALTAKDEQIADLSLNIQTLNQVSIPKNEQLAELSLNIQSQEQAARAKDEQIADLSLNIHSLEQSSKVKDEQIAELLRNIQDISIEINERNLRILSIERSITWQFTMKFHKIVEKILPANTRRRNYYDFGLKGGRILVNEGICKFYWHFNERRRVKKFENEIKRKRPGRNIQSKPYVLTDIDHAQIKFPAINTNVEISIIIPVHNKFQYTLNCLKSISDNSNENYEVVVVDDASTDETENQLKNIANLSVIRNKDNLGFIESCNKGVESSRGEYILFLNNDTVVTKNWLPPLLDLIKRSDVGAVGSKLVYPDGKLQEAGNIIWNDASGWNYGRGDNPEMPEYNFVRDVDYCSGAALIVKKDIFKRVKGFGTQFKPAYYEDTDLCFMIRDMGYRVLYQPQSVVIHFEGISNGTDISTGIKKYQELNKIKFFEKWKKTLTTQHYESRVYNIFDARIRCNGKKILVIDQYVPFFDRDSGSFRMSNILKILVDLGHRVTFIGNNFDHFDHYDSIMQQAGVEVLYSPFISSIAQYLAQCGQYFDIVILSRPHIVENHIAYVRKYCVHAKVVYDTVDLHFIRESRRAEILQDPVLKQKGNELKKRAINLAQLSDATVVVCYDEQQILMKEDPSLNVQIISNIHEVSLSEKKYSERKDILFLGAFLHDPNVDAVLWFVREIFPKIVSHIPDIKFYIVGDQPTNEIISLSSKNIIVTGYVENLTDCFNNCRVFVAPLRYGAGVKGKINQSMSRGLPVVTTSIGAEGMDLSNNENALIADDPNIFSQKVIQLYEDEQLWNKISKNSIENIQKNFSYDHSKKVIEIFINSLEQK